MEEWHFKLRCRSLACIFSYNVTLPQVLLKHFASKNQLPSFYIGGTLLEYGLRRWCVWTHLFWVKVNILQCLTHVQTLVHFFSPKGHQKTRLSNFLKEYTWKKFRCKIFEHFIFGPLSEYYKNTIFWKSNEKNERSLCELSLKAIHGRKGPLPQSRHLFLTLP